MTASYDEKLQVKRKEDEAPPLPDDIKGIKNMGKRLLIKSFASCKLSVTSAQCHSDLFWELLAQLRKGTS